VDCGGFLGYLVLGELLALDELDRDYCVGSGTVLVH
jgi:hypothetical protein